MVNKKLLKIEKLVSTIQQQPSRIHLTGTSARNKRKFKIMTKWLNQRRTKRRRCNPFGQSTNGSRTRARSNTQALLLTQQQSTKWICERMV